MKRILGLLGAAVLVLAVWGSWWWFDLPLSVAVVATAVIVVCVAAFVLWRVTKARRAASKLGEALGKQAQAQVARAPADARAEFEAMAAEFDRAVGALESERGKAALYNLPWYVIIGPPGVGKSTALRNSGLRPCLPERGGVVKGIGGTRNCDWWMTDQAVIVDTAGRYATAGSDAAEWLAFLDLLAQARPKRPINGILLAVSAIDLALGKEHDINALSLEIRARIDEVNKHLEMSLPIYVLFTKCDLLPGFVETFSHMSRTERQQIWGFSLPVAKADLFPARTFVEQFDRLAERNEQRALKRMSAERRIEARGRVFEFSQHFELLRENLATFIDEVFRPHPHGETPMLRGCYFTSGTQEGRPIDRLMGSMAQAFGLPRDVVLGAPEVEARSYFLGELFNRVIFADQQLAQRSARHRRRSMRIEWAVAAGLVALAIAAWVLPSRAMRANQEELAQVEVAVDELEDWPQSQVRLAPIERLWPLHEAQAELTGYERDACPLRLRWGMAQVGSVQPPTRELFGRTVRERLIGPLLRTRALTLHNFAERYADVEHEPPHDEAREVFDELRAYLLLTGDYQEYRPDLPYLVLRSKRAAEDEWLADHIADAWAVAFSVANSGATFAKMKTLARSYVTVLREHPELRIERDDAMVEGVREILRRPDWSEAWLRELLATASERPGVEDLTLESLRLGTNVYQNGGMRIRGAFTRPGWEKYARSYLAHCPREFVDTQWVLGANEREANERSVADCQRLRTRYFEQYIQEWDQFVARIYVDVSNDMLAALAMFQELAGGSTPTRSLLGHLAWHTTLEPEKIVDDDRPWYLPLLPEGAAEQQDQPWDLVVEHHDVGRHFEPLVKFAVAVADAEGSAVAGPLPVDKYQEQLATVRDALQAAIDDRAELDPLASALAAATRVVASQVSEQPEPWRNRFDQILRPPFDALQVAVEGDRAALHGASWCSNVYQPYVEQVADKYPFNPDGYDLPLDEFSAWFAPEQGPVWEFHRLALAGRMAGSRGNFNPKLPDFLDQYADIGAVMFPTGSDQPRFEFEVQILGTAEVGEIALTVDGQRIEYRNGPLQWTPMVWPGTEGEPGATIEAEGRGKSGSVVRRGDWGFWRLLADGGVTGTAGQQVYIVKWDLTDQQLGTVTVRLRPKRSATPLFGVPTRGSLEYLELFHSLQVPRSIVPGHACE